MRMSENWNFNSSPRADITVSAEIIIIVISIGRLLSTLVITVHKARCWNTYCSKRGIYENHVITTMASFYFDFFLSFWREILYEYFNTLYACANTRIFAYHITCYIGARDTSHVWYKYGLKFRTRNSISFY